MLRPIRSLMLVLALAACDSPTSVTPVPGDPVAQRQVWEQQGIDDYRFVQDRVCHCSPFPRVRVEVRDGAVVDVRDARTGQPVPRAGWEEILTVDALFDEMAEGKARGVDVYGEFHPELGYPMVARIGEMAFDEGVVYRITTLRRLD